MEYVPKINIFGQKMLVKSVLEKRNIIKFLHVKNYFPYFIKLTKITKSVKKITYFEQVSEG
jgi:hypothetical protein